MWGKKQRPFEGVPNVKHNQNMNCVCCPILMIFANGCASYVGRVNMLGEIDDVFEVGTVTRNA